MSATVVDVGAGEEPDERATETLDIQPPADHVADLESEWPFESHTVDTVIATHVLEHLSNPVHFFQEAARVIRPGGTLEVTVPLGEDAKTDHDHEQEWRFCTPEQFCYKQQRRWDPATGFELTNRRLRVWGLGPERVVWRSRLAAWLAEQWPAWAAHRAPAGELTAQYRRVEP